MSEGTIDGETVCCTGKSPDSCFVVTACCPGSKNLTPEVMVLHGYPGNCFHMEWAKARENGCEMECETEPPGREKSDVAESTCKEPGPQWLGP